MGIPKGFKFGRVDKRGLNLLRALVKKALMRSRQPRMGEIPLGRSPTKKATFP
jgi:hypothetical protein